MHVVIWSWESEKICYAIWSLFCMLWFSHFRCVCKYWYSMLDSPDFIDMHFQRSRNCHLYPLKDVEILHVNNSRLVHEYRHYLIPMYRLYDPYPWWSYERHIFALARSWGSVRPIVYMKTPNPCIPYIMGSMNGRKCLEMEAVGSINGLVCLAFNYGTCVIIWNPTTRKYYQVPDPLIPYQGYSFGFAEHNGHKVRFHHST